MGQQWVRVKIFPAISVWAPLWKILFPPRGPSGRQEFKDEVDRILDSGITLDHH
jgi:hypothetical protein